MKDIEQKKEELSKMYEAAYVAHLCNSQLTFANFVKTNPANISAAMSGNEKYLTDGLLRKCRLALIDAGVYSPKSVNSGQQIQATCTGGEQKNTIQTDSDIKYIVDKLTSEMKEQRESYERLLLAALQK